MTNPPFIDDVPLKSSLFIFGMFNCHVWLPERRVLYPAPWVFPFCEWKKNKMQPTNPNAHTYVNGTDVETWICSHAEHFSAIVYLNGLVHIFPVTSLQCGVESVECGVWSGKCRMWSVECKERSVDCKMWSVKCGVGSVECKV